MTQKAFKINISKKVVEEVQIPIPQIDKNQVLLKVYGAGVCHSDIAVRAGAVPSLPKDGFVGGHEIAGEAVEVGSNVKDVFKGGRYCVSLANACFQCNTCIKGGSNICEEIGRGYGVYLDGGWAQYMLIRRPSLLVEIPANVSYQAAAVALDSVLSPYHAIKKAGITPASKVLIIGAGGLGINAVQIAALFGARVTVLDKNPALRPKVEQYKVETFTTDLRENTKYPLDYFDVVIELVGLEVTYATALAYVARGGKIMAIGLSPKISFNLFQLSMKEVLLLSSFYGTVPELKECMELISRGVVKPEYTLYPFENVNSVLDSLHKGEISGRVVFNPNE